MGSINIFDDNLWNKIIDVLKKQVIQQTMLEQSMSLSANTLSQKKQATSKGNRSPFVQNYEVFPVSSM